jgi:RNA polymerase sigma-70 factor, ECF subfamily
MEAGEREELEREIRRRAELGDASGAVTVALRGYGPELFGFLMAVHRDETDASEVFSDASERIWDGFSSFGWRSSFRTWAYVIARHASLEHRRTTRRRARRQQELPRSSLLSAIAAEVRSETLPHLKTEMKSRMAALRDSLPPEDRELLVLRVDKRLAWNELAEVLHDGAAARDELALKREAARLRKRFQAVKERLIELGRREGLLQ